MQDPQTPQDSQSALNEALAALAANRPQDAADRLRTQAEQDAENALVHAALGMVLAQMGDPGGALEAFDRAHYLQPQNAQVLYHYGLALETLGRGRQARLRYEAALRLDPSFDPARGRIEALDQAPPPTVPPAAASTALPAATVPQVAAPAPVTPAPNSSLPAAPNALVRQETPRKQRGGTRSVPLSELPNRPVQNDVSRWDAPDLPGFGGLSRATLQLWASQLLLWLGIFALPNAAASALIAILRLEGWTAALVWSLGLGLGMAPVLLGMAGQWMEDRPFAGEGRLTSSRWAMGTLLSLAYVLVVVAPLGSMLALRVPFSAGGLVLGAVLLTIPFHALLAPSLMLTVTGQAAPMRSVGLALRMAGRRTWLHFGLVLALAVLAGGLLAAIAWGYVVTLRGGGLIVERTLEAAGVSLGETLFAALLTVAGLDAISARPPSEESERDALDETADDEPWPATPASQDDARRAEAAFADASPVA